MPTRNDSGMGALRTISVMALVSVFCGVLVAGLLIPVASLLGMGTNSVADGFKSLPLALREQPTPERTVVQDRNGQTVAYFYKQNRQSVGLDKVAPVMKDAILSIEDYRFYDHGPLDVQGTARAFVSNALGNPVQGGSSITQQLVKMILVQQADTAKERLAAIDDSYGRKLRELKYAMAYEQEHTKDEILRNYLNIAYFGDGAYGIHAAAKHFFSVAPSELDARQAATLAGLVKNPVAYDPTRYPQEALTRRNTVLDRMADLGKISQERADKLIAMPLRLKPTHYNNGCVSTVAPFFCDYVRRYLVQEEKALGDNPKERANMLDTGGLTIKTNLDQRMQRAGDRAVTNRVGAKDNAIGAQAMVVPGTGQVRAVAQSRPMGRNAGKGETYLNYTVPKDLGGANGFQAGSTFKAFTAAAALKAGYPTSTFFNAPQQMHLPAGSYTTCSGNGTGSWDVSNSTGAGGFPMSMGLAQSVNTYFAQLERLVGLCPTTKMTRSVGIDFSEEQEVPSFTLGVVDVSPLDMAAAYATFPGRGKYCKPHPVQSITDRDGESVVNYTPECKRVMPQSAADSMNQMLSYVQSPSGFGSALLLNQPSAAKTGTTTDNQAVWYMGYTANLVTSSMLAGANDDGTQRSLSGVTLRGSPLGFDQVGGSSLAGPMWFDAMKDIQRWLPNKGFPSPGSLGPTPGDTPLAPPPSNDNNGGNNNGNNGNGNNGNGNGNGNG